MRPRAARLLKGVTPLRRRDQWRNKIVNITNLVASAERRHPPGEAPLRSAGRTALL